MRLFLLSLLVIFICVSCNEAARVVRMEKRHENMMKREEGATPSVAEQAQDMIDKLCDGDHDHVEDDRGNQLTELTQFEDQEGNKVVHVNQQFKGLKVLGGRIADVSLNQRKKTLYSKNTNQPTGAKFIFGEREEFGRVIDGIDADLPDDLNPADFKPDRAVKELTKQAIGDVQHAAGETVIFLDEEDDNKAKVGYMVTIFDSQDGQQASMPTQLIDAKTNKVLAEWDALQTYLPPSKVRVSEHGEGPGGNKKTGQYEYGIDKTNYFVTELGNGRCKMETKQVKTIHLLKNPANTYRINDAWEFNCFDQEGDETNGAFSPLNDAMSFGEKVYQMYMDWYGEPPLRNADGTPRQLVMKMHFSENYQQAAWNGEFMIFGDGGDQFYPLISLDIASHEVAHGVTAGTSKLDYRGESGGLNEAFADMAGKAAERYARGPDGVKWTVGGDIVKGDNEYIRRMDEPWKGKTGKEIGHMRDYNSSVPVHQSSGIFNRVFYLMSQKFPHIQLKQITDSFSAVGIDCVKPIGQKSWTCEKNVN